ncbi:OLC1v1004256C1 [Oldenlandia corymbosa var. corymbosa]|uniref:OLC1v1004256C1 n=1 Tax=Oldenlandia corymbosa var. corymbosa TaxID=529605 RepID=A0AAV1DC44_OLDCO|nr:OLC1v1004256C1 [Oldenlandia corymbosa var. corymbosa]
MPPMSDSQSLPHDSQHNLSNLETLILVSEFSSLPFPDIFYNLRKLKYLDIRCRRYGGFLPIENIDNSSILHELEMKHLSKANQNFPSILKLECQFLLDNNNHMIVVDASFSKLESLDVSAPCTCECDFSLSASLKNLKSWNLILLKRTVSALGKLPNLQILKLVEVGFEGKTWEMDEGEFSNLKILKLRSIWNLVWWRGCDDDQFQCLEKLVLVDYHVLRELPSCLFNNSTLEVIHIFSCSEIVKETMLKSLSSVYLERLRLIGFELSHKNIADIGMLPNLEMLELINMSFEGNTWELQEGEFSRLKILKVMSSDLVSWRSPSDSDDPFGSLERLVLTSCLDLEEMPSCLEYLSTLEMTEANDCSETVNTLPNSIAEAEVGVVLYDVGVLFGSPVYLSNHQRDLPFLGNVSKSVKIIQAKYGDEDPEAPGFNFPIINQLCYFDFVVEKLTQVSATQVARNVKSRLIQSVQQQHHPLRSFLGDIVQPRHEHEDLQTLVG